ncbi:MAG: glycosyltransferase family 4 protein [Candidatus Poseidoniales archaeon]|nr:glycosyltransferase family 4 protein [Candidatus Poseidoniales archaeon]
MSPTVLHVGPVESRGGMQSTIRHHLANPPPGWSTEVIGTHVDGSAPSKWFAWRKGRRELVRRLRDDPPDIVHVHTATRYSWWRKRRVVAISLAAGLPVVLQVHSGDFHRFIDRSPLNGKRFRDLCAHPSVTPVALTPAHRDLIALPPDAAVIGSPAPALDPVDPDSRDPGKLLLLARSSPIKGHRLAISATLRMRAEGRDVNLHLSLEPNHPWVRGIDPEDGIHAHGWMSDEEKRELLRGVGLLLIPSEFEGMPVVAMEALSCGLPVLASPACAGILGGGGSIVPQLDARVWADAIAAILDDEQGWRQMCMAAPAAVADQTPEVIGARWANLYQQVMAGVAT